MLRHNFHKSQYSTTQTLLLSHNPFLSSQQNNAAPSSLPIPHKNRLSTRIKHRKKGLLRPINAVLTSTGKSTTVKGVITVLQTVGGILSHLSITRGLDDIADVFGKTLLVELVAAKLDPESGVEKSTIKSYASRTGKDENETYYESTFEIPEDFGEIGAVLIENEHHQEMFVKNIVFDGFSGGSLHVTCNSWIQPKNDNPIKRVFFSDKMEDKKVMETSLTSAAAFVEGGIQEACDDACSICLEAFCDSDPSTLTTCKHEFHLQCILEWCQRSSQCPMCWQSISLKDPNSQELLDAVEHERRMLLNPPRNTAIFHHPALGDFELQHLPVNASESELEERIIQHLTAAAAMGRARQLARREGQRSRSSQGHPHVLVFSTHSHEASPTSAASQRDGSGSNSPFMTVGGDSAHLIARSSSAQSEQLMTTASGSNFGTYQHGTSSTNRSPVQTSTGSQDRAGPSDFQSFSESLKTRLSALSTRYKESITKSTRGWKERLFARNNSNPEPTTTTEARGEVNRSIGSGAGIATISRMMDHLQLAEDGRPNTSTASTIVEDTASPGPSEGRAIITGGSRSLNEDDIQASTAAGSTTN